MSQHNRRDPAEPGRRIRRNTLAAWNNRGHGLPIVRIAGRTCYAFSDLKKLGTSAEGVDGVAPVTSLDHPAASSDQNIGERQ